MTSDHSAQAYSWNYPAGTWKGRRCPLRFYLILYSHEPINYMEKKRGKKTVEKRMKMGEEAVCRTKSIRTEGQWVIHLLVRHNYLFFFPLIYFFVHLGHGRPRKPKEPASFHFWGEGAGGVDYSN